MLSQPHQFALHLLDCRVVHLPKKVVLGEIVVPVSLAEVRSGVLQLIIHSKAERVGVHDVERRGLELPNLNGIDNIGDRLNLPSVGAVCVMPGSSTVGGVVYSDPFVE